MQVLGGVAPDVEENRVWTLVAGIGEIEEVEQEGWRVSAHVANSLLVSFLIRARHCVLQCRVLLRACVKLSDDTLTELDRTAISDQVRLTHRTSPTVSTFASVVHNSPVLPFESVSATDL